jgi:hypothetical protein
VSRASRRTASDRPFCSAAISENEIRRTHRRHAGVSWIHDGRSVSSIIQDAGRIAGLEVRRIINEPTAAALAFGLDK